MSAAAVVSLDRVREATDAIEALKRGATTLAGAWSLFQATDYRRLRPSSQKDYRTTMRRAVAELPAAPTAMHLADWLNRLEESNSERGPLSRGTRRKYQVIIADVFACVTVYTNNAAMQNELRQVPKPRQRARRRRHPNDDVVHYLETVAARTTAERAAVRLCAYVGLRAGELLALRPRDVFSYGEGVVLNVEYTRDRYGLRPRKNSDSERLHQPKLDKETARLVLALREEGAGREYLLPWSVNYTSILMRRWRRTHDTVRAAMPPGDGWHVLRHWGATKLAAQPGASEADVQAWLGNSTSSAAQTYMGQVRGTTRSADASTIARAVGPPPPIQWELPSATTGAVAPVVASTRFANHSTGSLTNKKGSKSS